MVFSERLKQKKKTKIYNTVCSWTQVWEHDLLVFTEDFHGKMYCHYLCSSY